MMMMWWIGPSAASKIFCWLALQLALSKIRNFPDGPGFNNEGITSILKLSSLHDDNILVLGTKRGSILIVQQDELLGTKDLKKIQARDILQAETNVEADPNASTTTTTTTSSSRKIPFPIFSLAFSKKSNGDIIIFSGGGDRYVTVWTKQQQTLTLRQTRNDNSLWTASQKLGPHTGWVKDVYYDINNEILHSIGCNCIESWKKKKKMSTEKEDHEDPLSLFSHWKKSKIESSPTAGSTLSSDILCLCGTSRRRQEGTNENGNSSKMMMDLLLAGGVDGRIHVWNSNDMSNQPLFSWSAHDGRINSLCILDDLLLSGSHDGYLKCWSIMKHVSHQVLFDEKYDRKNEMPAFELVSQVKVGEARITAITSCCYTKDDVDDERKHRFAFGTHNGLVYTATLVMSASTSTANESSVVEVCISNTIKLHGNPMVNALCCLLHFSDGNDDCTTLVIGHSSGLATIEFK